MTLPRRIGFDLDNTLSHTDEERVNWLKSADVLARTHPCAPAIQQLHTWLEEGHEICIITARTDSLRPVTQQFLQAHGLGHVPLRTQPDPHPGHDASGEYKARIIREQRLDLYVGDRVQDRDAAHAGSAQFLHADQIRCPTHQQCHPIQLRTPIRGRA